jgi:Ser/Thr protein kinase RdoA (MazF antagonist)
MGRADVYLQPEAADPVLSSESVLALAEAHTGLRSRVLEVDESGGEARAYLLQGDVVVKTQRPHRLRPRTSLGKEAHLLRHLASSLGDRIPHVLGYGRDEVQEGEVEYLVMSRMPGDALIRQETEPASRTVLLRELGGLLSRMHAVPTAELLADKDLVPVDTDGVALARRLEMGFADLVDHVAGDPAGWTPRRAPEDVAAAAVAMVPAVFTPVVLHSNPGPMHVFCTRKGALTGLIDFGDSYASHPAMDLRTWPDPADRLVLLEGYLDGTAPTAEFEAVWTAAMIYTDMAVLASRPALASAAASDLALRLGEA